MQSPGGIQDEHALVPSLASTQCCMPSECHADHLLVCSDWALISSSSPIAKDLQRRTCLGVCFGTVSVSTSRRGRDKGVTRLVLSLTISQDKTETRQTNLVSDCLETVSVLFFLFSRDTGNEPFASTKKREETKDVEIVKLARRDRDKTSDFLSRRIRKLQDKTETRIFMSLQLAVLINSVIHPLRARDVAAPLVIHGIKSVTSRWTICHNTYKTTVASINGTMTAHQALTLV
ncbi:hypothetical protein PROFUN_12936 [Planoprotostelium fungivorum]|uniref:Uncharacterized protein n=1 Tax=Planoprotostelium fungivorum TaxID=1890364 RepID=A0A2P6N5W2_9EUKA|nr:hypothetical protein PROFUN_12936 [Planoprotostelium fungivorum]